jgi:hypothetical protein
LSLAKEKAMGKSLLFLFLMLASATAFAAPPAAKKRPAEKRPAPATVKADCPTQKTRLHHDERLLRARQQLAYEECRASARPGSSRCDDLKRQQKVQRKEFKEQRKATLEQCKAVQEAKREPKDQGKKAARSR